MSRVLIFLLVGLFLNAFAHAQQCYPDAVSAYRAVMAQQMQTQAISEQININTATVGELASLQGVGAKTAQAIVDYRQAVGRFDSVDDLEKVKGIGKKTLDKNRHRLSVY